jgi:hypothetical protein
VLEVPHEGRGVEEADGGDAQAGFWCWVHCLLDYQPCVKDWLQCASGAYRESTWSGVETRSEERRQVRVKRACELNHGCGAVLGVRVRM